MSSPTSTAESSSHTTIDSDLTKSSLLRFSTAGSVDDGKSTFIGRLLHDSKNIYDDHLKALHKASTKHDSKAPLSLALLTDGLKAEQEQGITIDVAYRYFSTPKRHFILADTPGHEQYTRNMATGASTANLTIILIDARNGVVTQTRRHAFIASLLGVPRFLVAVNKMDLVNFSQDVFEKIRSDFQDFATRLEIRDIRFVPVSALQGDNIVVKSESMPWYIGETVMQYLENVYIGGDVNNIDFRFPVQSTIRPNQKYRGYAGQIASGLIRVGEEVTILPSMRKSTISSIDIFGQEGSPCTMAQAPMSVALSLSEEIDVGRGDMIVRSNNLPSLQSHFEAMIVWMSETPMAPERHYIIQHTTRTSKAYIEHIKYKVDVNTLSRTNNSPLHLNEIGRVAFTTAHPLPLDSYNKNRATGNFILIDALSNHTVAAGMVLDRLPEQVLSHVDSSEPVKNLHLEKSLVSVQEREIKHQNRAMTLWLTGLSGSGKSTISQSLERLMFEEGMPVYRLDGDNIRYGLNSDLGFSDKDRSENIRRVAEVARLFNLAGISVVCSLISPFEKDRLNAARIIGEDKFVLVYLNTDLQTCESRDPHGLYKKARAGEIRGFTGIDSSYETPTNPQIVLDTSSKDLEGCLAEVYREVKRRSKI
jgi:bifunctional enzyme CysN/CysC